MIKHSKFLNFGLTVLQAFLHVLSIMPHVYFNVCTGICLAWTKEGSTGVCAPPFVCHRSWCVVVWKHTLGFKHYYYIIYLICWSILTCFGLSKVYDHEVVVQVAPLLNMQFISTRLKLSLVKYFLIIIFRVKELN